MGEKACEHYVCRSCGASMVSANFVTGICIQVFVSHGDDCQLYAGSAFERTKEVTCASCRYYDEESSCCFEGAKDRRIESVRTSGRERLS